jgi:hypothetical protein
MFTQISVYFNTFLIKAILRKVQINIRKSKLNESNVCSSGRFDIAVQKKADWIKFQTISFTKKSINVTEITGMGATGERSQ